MAEIVNTSHWLHPSKSAPTTDSVNDSTCTDAIMLPLSTGREANTGNSAPPYVHHRPERTLLYQLIEKYYPVFEAQCVVEDRILPDYVRQEFEDYLKCGRLVHGYTVTD